MERSPMRWGSAGLAAGVSVGLGLGIAVGIMLADVGVEFDAVVSLLTLLATVLAGGATVAIAWWALSSERHRHEDVLKHQRAELRRRIDNVVGSIEVGTWDSGGGIVMFVRRTGLSTSGSVLIHEFAFLHEGSTALESGQSAALGPGGERKKGAPKGSTLLHVDLFIEGVLVRVLPNRLHTIDKSSLNAAVAGSEDDGSDP